LWLAGRLFDLWQQLPETVRGDLDQQVQASALRMLEQSEDKQRGFVTLLGFHPATVAVRRQLAEMSAARGEFLATEQLLLQLRRNPDRAVAAAATERLARLMVEF